MFSIFDVFKIGVGPSSSHTVGPMKAAKQFALDLEKSGKLESVTRVSVDIYGSLSLTGKGHLTDVAIILGLAGNSPEFVEIETIPTFIKDVEQNCKLLLGGKQLVDFPNDSVVFNNEALELHENGMSIHAFNGDDCIYSKTYFSIGGGTIVDEENFGKTNSTEVILPYPYGSAADLLKICRDTGMGISTITLENEKMFSTDAEIKTGTTRIWDTMKAGIENGLKTEGVLLGSIKLNRRAASLHRHLLSTEKLNTDPMAIIDWVNVFALAVSEENAAGGRVVTSPTNGAAGIIPAVLAYYDKFVQSVGVNEYTRYFATTTAIASLYKMNASISGAEVGCQGEVGVACSMAAAGLAELLGGSPEQVCIAAEIGMEHNLGLTCDPIGGLVQVPCIERNAIAAVKAINATRMAMRRTSEPLVCLDKVIKTMLETGKDMHSKYRETSQGGLAIRFTSICD